MQRKTMSNSSASSSGIGFWGMLQILFIGLKLTNYVAWPWWQVMLPIIISLSIFVIVLIAFLIYLLFKK